MTDKKHGSHATKHAPTKHAKPDWAVLAAALPTDEFKLGVPIAVLLGEAVDVAGYFETHWSTMIDPATKKEKIRGLETAGATRLPKTTGTELLELMGEVQHAQSAYLRTVDPHSPNADKMARGRFIVDEITATLEWIFNDGVEDEKDAQLASVESAHANDPFTADSMALALEDFSDLGKVYRKEITDVGGFDVALLDEARKLAAELRALPASPLATSTASKVALATRNRLLQLLQARIDLVRAAARFVYRQTPAAAKEALSFYEHKRRAQAKRAAAKTQPPVIAPPPAPTPVVTVKEVSHTA